MPAIHLASLNLLDLLLPILVKYWWVLAILLALKILQSPKFKGWLGESYVNRALKKLDSETYFILHDLYLPRADGKGTTQIDHIVFSPFGIFVIETKNYQGWIFGSEKQRQWTQKIYKKSSKFQNPLHQNNLHINALSTFLNLPKENFHSIIYFIGDCIFKTDMPSNVLTKKLVSYIKGFQQQQLSAESVVDLVNHLHTHQQSLDKKQVAKDHVKALRRA